MQSCVREGVKTTLLGGQRDALLEGAFASLPVPAHSNNIGEMVRNGVADVRGPSGSIFSLLHVAGWPCLGWIWDFGVQCPGSGLRDFYASQRGWVFAGFLCASSLRCRQRKRAGAGARSRSA